MTAISLMAECKKALPDAQVFVLIDGRYKRIDSVVLSGVDPVVTGLTSVCLDGEEYFRVVDIPDVALLAETLRRAMVVTPEQAALAPDSEEKVAEALKDDFGGDLFNLYSRTRQTGFLFPKRLKIVRAMLATMLRAEATL
jgi:hypothetical protein